MNKERKDILTITGGMLLIGVAAVGAVEVRDKLSDNNQNFVPESTTSSTSTSDFRESLASKSPEEIQSLKSSYLFISGNF